MYDYIIKLCDASYSSPIHVKHPQNNHTSSGRDGIMMTTIVEKNEPPATGHPSIAPKKKNCWR